MLEYTYLWGDYKENDDEKNKHTASSGEMTVSLSRTTSSLEEVVRFSSHLNTNTMMEEAVLADEYCLGPSAARLFTEAAGRSRTMPHSRQPQTSEPA